MSRIYTAQECLEVERLKHLLLPLVRRGTLEDFDKIKKIIRNNASLWKIGGYKKVYRHRKIPSLLIKLWDTASSRQCEGWKEPMPKKARPFFLRPIVINDVYLIQKMANGKGGTPLKASGEIISELFKREPQTESEDYLGLHDIFSNNCAYHNGSPYFFDYVFGCDEESIKDSIL